MMDKDIKDAKKCPYYGCAGTRICTYYSWTTDCHYPNCNKREWNGETAYDNNVKPRIARIKMYTRKIKNNKFLWCALAAIAYLITIYALCRYMGIEEGLMRGVFTIFFLILSVVRGIFSEKDDMPTAYGCIILFIVIEAIISAVFIAAALRIPN